MTDRPRTGGNEGCGVLILPLCCLTLYSDCNVNRAEIPGVKNFHSPHWGSGALVPAGIQYLECVFVLRPLPSWELALYLYVTQMRGRESLKALLGDVGPRNATP